MKAITRGDTRTRKVTITDLAGAPVNIGGHSLWMTLKKNVTDADPGALQVQDVQPSNADTLAGKGAVVLPSDKTALLEPGIYWYDLQWVRPGTPPVVDTIESGRVRVKADVTRSTA